MVRVEVGSLFMTQTVNKKTEEEEGEDDKQKMDSIFLRNKRYSAWVLNRESVMFTKVTYCTH